MKNKKINLSDLIFILFYRYGGEIKGSTTLQKYIDIIRLDSDLEVDVEYKPYHYGDYSQQVSEIVQVFLDNKWLEKNEIQYLKEKKINIFNLTSKGNKIAQYLYKNLLNRELKALKILDKFEEEKQEDILAHSYFWYPSTATESKIKKNIFQRSSSILSNLEGELESEYLLIKKSDTSIKEIIQKSWKC